MCAVADFPTPKSKSGNIGVTFVLFPVNMNVLDTESGSCSKLETACCAATKALVVLMLKSCVKALKGRESGFFASFRVAAPAAKMFGEFSEAIRVLTKAHTIINDNAWEAQ